jgi:hypothetical protein
MGNGPFYLSTAPNLSTAPILMIENRAQQQYHFKASCSGFGVVCSTVDIRTLFFGFSQVKNA